jgi:chromosome segregation ATPase
MAQHDDFNDLVFKLGDVAFERLMNKPTAPRSMDRAIKAADALALKEDELAQLNQAMDEEETAFTEFSQAVEQEKEELVALTKTYSRAVKGAESRYQLAREKISAKDADLKHAKLALQKEDLKIADMVNRGDKAKVAVMTANLKNMRMEIMRRQRELRDMNEEAEKIINPVDNDEPSEAIRSSTRIKDLDKQMEERQTQYNETLAALDAQAADKEGEIQAARDYYDQAVFLLGEEVYQARINDSALVPLYLKLDRLGR